MMSNSDKAMPHYFRLVTRWNPQQVEVLENDMKTGKIHPRDAKMKLAMKLRKHSTKRCADAAEQDFILKFQKKRSG